MKSIVLCVDLNQKCLDTLKTLPRSLDLKNCMVHLVHTFEIHFYNIDLIPVVYPTEEQYPDIERSTLTILNQLAADLGLDPRNTKAECFFTHSREEKIKEYLTTNNIDMAVVATRGQHGIEGLFSSSLADFLVKYSPCNVFVMRPDQN